MIAEVYPILRLPRKCTYFDYDIPVVLNLAPGDLVKIPFKGRETLGIVRGLKATSTAKRLAAVNELAIAKYLTVDDLKRYESIAEHLVQSVGSILMSIFPNVFTDGVVPQLVAGRSASIDAADIAVLKQSLQAIAAHTTLALSGDKDMGLALAYALRRQQPGQMLILLPRERDANLLADYISLGSSVGLLHGHTKPKDRARLQEAWRTGQLNTLIGTRNASLLPAHKLSTVLVLESGNHEYKNERRNPRFDAREAVKLLAANHGAKLVFFDALPRLEEVYQESFETTLDTAEDEVIVNLGSADELTDEPMLSESLIIGIEKALHNRKNVLVFLNRKGVAKRLQCGKCGHIPLCGTCGHVPMVRHDDLVCGNCQTEMWIPDQCPACGKPKLALKGIGGTKVIERLRKLFPANSVGRIEKGHVDQPEADIVVATEYFFSSYVLPFSARRFGLVADLAADITLHASDFRGAEDTARKLHRLIAFAKRQGAQALVQTWLPDVLRPMLDLKHFVKQELDIRERYQLPPFSSRYILKNANLDDLPPELKDLATERDENLEITCARHGHAVPQQPNHLHTTHASGQTRRTTSDDRRLSQPHPLPLLTSLPQTVKITYDGPYAQSHDSPPQS